MKHLFTSQLPRRSFRLWITWILLPLVLLAVQPSSTLAAGAGKSDTGDSPFIGQTQIAATVLLSYRAVGVFQVDLGLLVLNPVQRARATALQPVLRDAWRRTTQEFANSYLAQGRVPDAMLLGQRLQSATDQVLGAGNARLLLTSVIVR